MSRPQIFPACRAFRLGAVAGLTLMVVACMTSKATAQEWMFRRSYFSHAVPEDDPNRMPDPPIRYAHRPPLISGAPGYYLRGGHRYNRVQINAGSGVDVTVFYDEWFRTAP